MTNCINLDEISAEDIVKKAEEMAEKCKNIEKTQLRKIYDCFVKIKQEVSLIEEKDNKIKELKNKLILLDIDITYKSAKNPSVNSLRNFLKDIIKNNFQNSDITDWDTLSKRLYMLDKLLQGIVAYHKFNSTNSKTGGN